MSDQPPPPEQPQQPQPGEQPQQPGQQPQQPGQQPQQPGQQPQQPGQQPQPGQTIYVERAGSGMAVTALVLGILGMIIALIPILGIFGIAMGLTAFILGLVGRSKAKKGTASGKGLATAGFITGALAVVLGIVGVVIVGNAFNDLDEELQNIDEQFQEDMPDLEQDFGG